MRDDFPCCAPKPEPPEITPALLAEFKHRVPSGATILAGTPVLTIGNLSASLTLIADGWDFDRSTSEFVGTLTAWTREPIRPPLPTGLGAVLRDVTTTNGKHWDYAVRADTSRSPWTVFDLANSDGGGYHRDADLSTWTVVSEGVEL